MKKFIIALLLTACLPVSALNYWPVEDYSFTVIARGGYEFLNKTPNINVGVGFSIGIFKAELEVGGTQFILPDLSEYKMPYSATMCGISFGTKHSVYAMIGITNWALVELNSDDHTKYTLCDGFRGKAKIGANFSLTERLILNIDFSGICPYFRKQPSQRCYIDYTNVFLSAGIGVKL